MTVFTKSWFIIPNFFGLGYPEEAGYEGSYCIDLRVEKIVSWDQSTINQN